MSSTRSRLQKKEAEHILAVLKDKGFKNVTRRTNVIIVWDDDVYYARCLFSFKWIPKVGWQLQISQPPIRTHEDFKTALGEIELTRRHLELADTAWKEYQGSPSTRKWQKYQGTMAMHFARMGQLRTEQPNDES